MYALKGKQQEPVIDRLINVNGVFVDSHFDKPPLPELFEFEGCVFYRYMDRLFSSVPITKLNSKESVQLCDVRLKYFDNLIDHQLNGSVVDEIKNILNKDQSKRGNILDFGCGNGKYTATLKNEFPTFEFFGIDISQLAIEYANKENDRIFWLLVNEKEQLPFKDEYFFYIVSTFVMHLDIDKILLNELHRVLKNDGVFIFNIYNKKYLKNYLIEKFKHAGFCLDILPIGNLPTNHLLFLARKDQITINYLPS